MPGSPHEGDFVPTSPPMLDHVGVMVRDLDSASDHWKSRFGLNVDSVFAAPSLNIRATFFVLGSAKIELFTIDEERALEAALGDGAAKIDHIALRFEQSPTDSVLSGCTIRGPGRPDRIDQPFRIAGLDHVWTEPPDINILLQLITPVETT